MSQFSDLERYRESPLFFYGCGPLLEACFEEICSLIGRAPDGLIDSDPTKIGQKIFGHMCYSPETLGHHQQPVVVVTARRHWPIERKVLDINPRARVLHAVFQPAFHKAVRLDARLTVNRDATGPPLATDFRGCRAVITGATRGIGLALAKQLAALGFDLVIGGRDRELLRQVTDSLGHYGRDVISVCADLGQENGLSDFLTHPAIANQPADLVYNNAGVATPDRSMMDEPVVMQDMLTTYAVNVVAPIAIAEHFLRLSSLGHHIRIVFLTSNLCSATHTTYTITKLALHKYINDSEDVYGRRGAALYMLDPGDIHTKMNPTGLSNVDAVFPAALLPLYLRKRQGIGYIHANELAEMPLNQAATYITDKYGTDWRSDTLNSGMALS